MQIQVCTIRLFAYYLSQVGTYNTQIGCSDGRDFFNGSIDEVIIFNRSLTTDEIKKLYERGITKLNTSIRSCDDSECTDKTWTNIGTNNLLDLNELYNQYFQYKTIFTTENTSYSPELYNVTINYGFSVAPLILSIWYEPSNATELSDINLYLNISDNNIGQNITCNIT